MKRQILPLLAATAVMVFFVSCKKESMQKNTQPGSDEVITLKLSLNQAYQINIPDAGSLSIGKQASHYLVSEATTDNESGIALYKYTPSVDFTGNDEVLLLSTKSASTTAAGSSGCPGQSNNSGNPAITAKYITVKITVDK